jgi:NAD+ synthase (glutamine-hydrolysing)
VTEENLQSRARGMLLMALSNKFGWLLLTTGNKSELATGYATLYGDMAGGFAVIKDVPKLLVYELSRWRNRQAGGPAIPESSIEKVAICGAAPGPDRPGFPSPIPGSRRASSSGTSNRTGASRSWSAPGTTRTRSAASSGLVDLAEYKRRQSAPGVKITPRAFGKDRRLPITSGWR